MESQSTPQQIIATAKDTVFNEYSLNLINEKHRDFFVLGFATRFRNNEIAYDDVDDFKMGIMSEIVNNHGKINSIYKFIYNGIFSKYRINTVRS